MILILYQQQTDDIVCTIMHGEESDLAYINHSSLCSAQDDIKCCYSPKTNTAELLSISAAVTMISMIQRAR